MLTLDGSTLLISARSPFARRVRLALQEHGVRYEEQLHDVFAPTPELVAANPLVRVPALRMSDGRVVTESERILGLLYRSFPNSEWIAPAEHAIVAAQASGLAVGLCEKLVENHLEHVRPPALQDREVIAEIAAMVPRVLDRLEAIVGSVDTVVPGRLTQADLDVGTALAYLTLRYPLQWRALYPGAARYLARLEQRPSFVATRPPAA